MANAHKSVVRDQMRRGIVPPLNIQPARLAVCGGCGGQIDPWTDPHGGAWEGRVLVYRHNTPACARPDQEGGGDG